MFYAVIQHGLDFWESSFFCGSAAVLRRSALLEVGGISGQSITEVERNRMLLGIADPTSEPPEPIGRLAIPLPKGLGQVRPSLIRHVPRLDDVPIRE